MRIRDLLDPKSICLDASPVSKEDAISILVDYMARSGCLNDVNRYREAVFDRERKSSTGLGEGIAIPHAKSAGVDRPSLATMVVPKGVDFEAFDDEKVHLLFLIASPHQASDAHLDVLARLSMLLMRPGFRDSLLAAKTVDEYLDAIDKAEAELDAKEAAERAAEEAEAAEEAAAEAAAANASTSAEGAATSEGSGDGANAAAAANTAGAATATSATSSAPKTEPVKKKRKGYDIVAVTACPAGLSHTYMAAEALEQKAKEMGITIKVEADGAAGNRNSLLPEEIASAKAVIVAADRAVDIDRFVGKRMVRTGVVDGVHKPEMLIKKALDPNCPVYKIGSMASESSNLPMKLYRHLMSGLTYILPLAATAGILSAVARLDFVKASSLGLFLDTIGYSIGTLLFPVLSAFIAFSMAGRMALVAGFTGGVMADMASAGVIGAVLNGFVGGGVAFVIARIAQRFLKGHDAMFALLVYPLAGAVFTTLIAQFVTNLPAALIDTTIVNFINDSNTLVLTIIGAVLAGMMSADMGGPFNKIAYATGVLLLADCLPENGAGSMIMGAVMLGGMVPPIAAGIAARFIAPHRFSEKQVNQGVSAIIKGFFFITEGVIPYLTLARLRVACILGSATAGALSMFFRCGVPAPHGGVFLMPIAINPLFYVLSFVGGIVVGTALFVLLSPAGPKREKAKKQKKEKQAKQDQETEPVVGTAATTVAATTTTPTTTGDAAVAAESKADADATITTTAVAAHADAAMDASDEDKAQANDESNGAPCSNIEYSSESKDAALAASAPAAAQDSSDAASVKADAADKSDAPSAEQKEETEKLAPLAAPSHPDEERIEQNKADSDHGIAPLAAPEVVR